MSGAGRDAAPIGRHARADFVSKRIAVRVAECIAHGIPLSVSKYIPILVAKCVT